MRTILALSTFVAPSVQAVDKSNILVLMADDWSWPHAGALGDRTVKTPFFK